jgi:hypothetical protein
MKNIINSLPVKILLAGIAFCGIACKKNFESYNTNPVGVSSDQLAADYNIGSFFNNMQSSIFNTRPNYQIIQNINADCFSGYMMSADPFNPSVNNLNYNMTDRWNATSFSNTYTNVTGTVYNLGLQNLRNTNPDFWAIAMILDVVQMDRTTDKFGPLPYSKVGANLLYTPYDSQKDIYNLFFLRLDTAVSNLRTFIAGHPGATPFKKFDQMYAGDYTKWLKLANSLRLRLAMHIVKVDPVTAQAQAQTALADAGGVLTLPNETATIAAPSTGNPLYGITINYANDISMGAAAESYLKGFNDPRLPKYFLPATDASAAGQYKGIRMGLQLSSKGVYQNFSQLNYQTTFTVSAPMILMTAAEVWFLKAEAALRGWTGAGNSQTDYETGINTSLAQWGVANANYINDSTSVPINYVDPKNAANNALAVSTVTIKWNTSATKEQQLEKIMTQKWIAMFPEGQEAWTEYRRTGYPKLFPVVVNNSNGTISTQTQIRRIAYPVNEYNTNGAEVAKGVQLLQGPDNGGTRLWWDVDKANF